MIFLVALPGGRVSRSVPGFVSRQQCEAAAEKLREIFGPPNRVWAVCVLRGDK